MRAARQWALLVSCLLVAPVAQGDSARRIAASEGAPPGVQAAGQPAAPPFDEGDWTEEIRSYFRATRKWFGMVADLRLDRAEDGTITPDFTTLHSPFVIKRDPAGLTLTARLPPTADGPHTVLLDRSDGFSVRTQELGILPVPAQIVGGLVVYRGAVAGGDLIYKLTPTHVDEYLYLRDPPPLLERRFEFDTGTSVVLAREVGNMVELVGRDGVARLRASAPLARAADGARRHGTIRVQGRQLIEEIDLTGLVPPVLVDPDWTTTGTMTVGHWADAAYLRPDGRVMAIGGCALTGCPATFTQSACGQVLASTDVWDEPSGTWTSGPPLVTGRFQFSAVTLAGGDLLVAGGCTTPGCTATTGLAERFTASTLQWTSAGSLSAPRANPMAALVGGSDVVVAGGCTTSTCVTAADRYHDSASSWSPAAPLPAARGFGTATTLADGRMLVVGGCADGPCNTVLADAVVYDPALDIWSAAGTMSSARAGHAATLLADGTVLVTGGCTDGACKSVLSSVDIWNGGAFSPGPPMTGARHNHTSTRLRSGEVLIAGGEDATTATVPTSEAYLPVARQWVGTSAMMMSRAYHVAAALPDTAGNVLVAGGCNPATCMPWAELFSPASLPADKDGGVPEAGPSDSGPVDSGSPIPPAAPARSPHPPLYRTGTLTCATDTTQDLKCPVVGYDLEDGDFQPNAHSFSATADEVTDAVTGLVWQRAADGTTYDNATAIKHCAALSSTEAKAGSFRLPSVVELMTLIDYGRDLPSVDPSFKGIQPTNYWTSTSVLGTQKLAWTVKLDFGEVLPLLDTSALPAVCVRGQSTVLNVASGTVRKAGALTVQGETVVDATGGLEWQRQDDGVKRSWQDSLAYCSALSLAGKSGWHLANVGELSSIVEFDKAPSGVNLDPAFQDGKADIYWTSSQNEGAPTLSWSITFNLGVIDGVTYTGLAYARCVRHTAEPNQEPDAGPGADAGSDASPADAGPSVSASGGGGGCGCEIGPARADGQLTGAFGVVTAILGLAWARQRGRRVELHATGEVRDA